MISFGPEALDGALSWISCDITGVTGGYTEPLSALSGGVDGPADDARVTLFGVADLPGLVDFFWSQPDVSDGCGSISARKTFRAPL